MSDDLDIELRRIAVEQRVSVMGPPAIREALPLAQQQAQARARQAIAQGVALLEKRAKDIGAILKITLDHVPSAGVGADQWSLRIIPINAPQGTDAIYGHGIVFEIGDDGTVTVIFGEAVAATIAPGDLTTERIEGCFLLALKRIKARL
jgi:hypothetical protein